MILSGAIFKFDKLNQSVSERGTVPLIADIMASRWAYEALTVEQYKGNPFYEDIFPFAVLESEAKYKNTYWRPELESQIGMAQLAMNDLADSDTQNDSTATSNLQLFL
jgi:hypothetical protein